MRIAYLINQYPKISLTFIRREILALERQKFEVIRIALRGWAEELVDEEDQHERERTRYVLRYGPSALLLPVLRILLTRPQRLLDALMLAWRVSRRSERSFGFHLAYLAEACQIILWLGGMGAKHLHAHFGTNSAEVAMLVHALGGPRWSFTVHGPEEFDKCLVIGLATKVRQCAFVVAVSSFGRSQILRLLKPQFWSKVHVVRCGLDEAYRVLAKNSAPAGRRFICVGRLCEQKGHLLLVEAARRLVAAGVDFELLFAGDGELRSEIEILIARHNLQSRLRITGWLSNQQVRNECLAARALVLPSFAEGLPVVIMEAMALGRPVISTFVGGIPELVRPGENGWLIPAGDVEALVQAMRNCLETPTEVLSRMGEAGRKLVLENHTADNEAAKLATLFNSLSE